MALLNCNDNLLTKTNQNTVFRLSVMAPRWGFPGLAVHSEYKSTSLWIGLSKKVTGDFLFPSASILGGTANFTFLTRPSSPGYVSAIRASCHLFLGWLSSLMMTMSSIFIFLLVGIHFGRCCNVCRNSFFHLNQNSLARYCTRRQRLREYRSACWKTPGGGRSTLVFIVSSMLGVRGVG